MGTITITDGPGKKAIEQMIKDSGLVAKIGFFESATYPDGTDIAYVASIQEYGAPSQSIPARPFMRPTMDEEANTWKKIVEDGCRLVSEEKMTIYDVMERVGLQAAGDCKAKIASIWEPALAERTVVNRADRAGMHPDDVSRKPLVDTGAMLAHLVNKTEQD